jgi:hypothetical protein
VVRRVPVEFCSLCPKNDVRGLIPRHLDLDHRTMFLIYTVISGVAAISQCLKDVSEKCAFFYGVKRRLDLDSDYIFELRLASSVPNTATSEDPRKNTSCSLCLCTGTLYVTCMLEIHLFFSLSFSLCTVLFHASS